MPRNKYINDQNDDQQDNSKQFEQFFKNYGLPEEDVAFLIKKMPPYILQALIEDIKNFRPSLESLKKIIQQLKKNFLYTMEKAPFPTLEEIDIFIEKLATEDPNHPLLEVLEKMRSMVVDVKNMVEPPVKENYSEVIDSLLDQYSKKEITKEQLQTILKEFARYRNNWLKHSKNKKMIHLSKKQWENLK